MVDLDLVQVIRDAIAQLAPERAMKLMNALPPEQRLAGLPPEQRLAGLPPEQRLAGLTEAERQELFMLLSRSAKPATTGGVVAP